MKKYKLIIPIEYVGGYLRYGHGEKIVEAESKEKVKEMLEKEEIEIDDYDLIVDDYEVNDCGDIDYENIEIEEVK